MGTVHRFPSERVKGALYPVARGEAAEILILPAIRIERHEDFAEPSPQSNPPEDRNGSKTRRRARRG